MSTSSNRCDENRAQITSFNCHKTGYSRRNWQKHGRLPYIEYVVVKDVDTVAREVVDGKWRNGAERKRRLEAAGYDYAEVQKRVNRIMKTIPIAESLAQEVLAGKWGNGNVRKERLELVGYDYRIVQDKVNEIVRRR